MTQDTSALMDGELESHEFDRAIQACCRDEQAARAWHEYHFIGEAMRQQATRPSRIAGRVMEALREEPTVLAPRAARARPLANVARVALAAAASVATVGVVVWIGFTGSTVPTGTPMAAAPAQATDIQQVVHTVGVPAPVPADIRDYLAAHRQTASPEHYRPVSTAANARP